MTIRLYLVEDHTMMREGLRAILQHERDFRIVGESGDGIGVAPKVETLKPDVVVLDLMLPGTNGLEVTRQIFKSCPSTHVVILSMYNKAAYIAEAIDLGVSAYVLKESASEELVQAIRLAVQGEQYFSRNIDQKAVEEYLQKIGAKDVNLMDSLTEREREIILLAAQGLSSAEIGKRLVISRRTVEKHRERAMHKLGLQNLSELLRYLISNAMLDIDGRQAEPGSIQR
jgi:two-component system response regulator NreC